jgi:heptosyltransferase-2
MKDAAQPRPPRRLLVRGVNWLGDAVMTTPALLRLREALPHTHITLLTPEKLQDLWQDHPDVDDVLTFAPGAGLLAVANRLRRPGVAAGFREAMRVVKSGWPLPGLSELEPAAARVRREMFDVALVWPNSPRAALEVWLAGIPRRVGYARPWRSWLLTLAAPSRPDRGIMHRRSVAEIRRCIAAPPTAPAQAPELWRQASLPAASPGTRGEDAALTGPQGCGPAQPAGASPAHQIHEYLHLAALLGADATPTAPFLFVSEAAVADTRGKFALSPDTDWLGLNPGAEYGPAKRWPKASFIAAAKAIHARTGCGLIVFGGPADAPLAAEICAALRAGSALVRDLSGRTSLRELCAALKLCRVALTNDTGPMHVAAAVGTPVVVPFGSTSPALTGPGLPGDPRHRFLSAGAPCSPCFRRDCPIDFRCLTGLGPDRVVEAVCAAWDAQR